MCVHQYAFLSSYFTGITCEAGIAYPSGAPGFTPDFSGVHVAPVFRVMFCRSSFVLLSFFSWPLCWLRFYDLRLLITSLVSYICISPLLYCFLLSSSSIYCLDYFGLFHDYIIIHCFIHIIITIILDYFMIILLYIALFTSLLLLFSSIIYSQ